MRESMLCLLLSTLGPTLWIIDRTATAQSPNALNVVLIVADDLGWADVGWHGGPFKTPNLDRLCKEGIELDQHYVSPMCSPTRAALLSGRYASRFGCTAAQNERVYPDGTETLASALKTVSYETALCGKYHLCSDPAWGPQRFGFDHGYGSLAGGCGPYDHKYKKGQFSDTWHRNGTLVTEEGHITDLIAEEAIRWLEGRSDKPFFLYVPFTAVHIPIKEPKEWLDRYADVGPACRREYAACVTHLDDAVGRIVAAVDRLGKRDNTLIVFTSDNGGVQAENEDHQYPEDGYTSGKSHGNNLPLRGNKTQLYEGGIRVSAFINWKGNLQPGKYSAPLHAVDWMPTICSLAGYQPQKDLRWDGKNVWPWLSGKDPPRPRTLYWAGTRFNTAAARDGDWKFFFDRTKERYELFDLSKDPHEKHDLAAEQPERLAKMKSLLAELSRADVTERPAD